MKQQLKCFMCGKRFSSRIKSAQYCSIDCKIEAEGDHFDAPSYDMIRFAVFARDGFRCVYCGTTARKEILEIDHVLPRIEGGEEEPENLVTACGPCNSTKGCVVIKPDVLKALWNDAFYRTDENLKTMFRAWLKTKRKREED